MFKKCRSFFSRILPMLLGIVFLFAFAACTESKKQVAKETNQQSTPQLKDTPNTEKNELSKKPWIANKSSVVKGKIAYMNYCSFCHGSAGLGDGPAGSTLNPTPRNLVEGNWKRGGKSAQLFKSITDGLPGSPMASFRHISLKERWQIVHFIRSITKNAPEETLEEVDEFGKGSK